MKHIETLKNELYLDGITLSAEFEQRFADLILAAAIPNLHTVSISSLPQEFPARRSSLTRALAMSQLPLVKIGTGNVILLQTVLELAEQGAFQMLKVIDATRIADSMSVASEIGAVSLARVLPGLRLLMFDCSWFGACVWLKHLLQESSNAQVVQVKGFDSLVENYLIERGTHVLYRHCQEALCMMAQIPEASTQLNPELDEFRIRSRQLLKLIEADDETPDSVEMPQRFPYQLL